MFVLLLVISSLVGGIHSFSLVNNVSVSSDVFSQLFLDEIKNNPNKVYVSVPDVGPYNSQKCLLSLREIIKHYPSPQISRWFDAWGSIPAGVLTGNQYDLGNYDQCVKSALYFDELPELNPIAQQYCFANLPLKSESPPDPLRYWDLSRSINIGICAPHTCSPELLTSIYKESTKTIFDGAFSEISVKMCSDGKNPALTALNIIGICVFGVLTALMILSAAYEIYVTHYQKKPKPVLLAYSFLTNGKRLFAINTKRSQSSIDCLTGLRVISTLWIILHHTYIHAASGPLINFSDYSAWFLSLEFMPVYNGSITVDTFFFMGGLLVAWIGFKDLDKTNGKINVIMNMVHRYIRLTPILIAGMILAYSINNIMYTGPFKETYMSMRKCNEDSWWPILLYIQNYLRDPNLIFDACYAEAWYLAIDFQLYALSPLILIPMWKWGKKFVPVLVALGVVSIGWVMGIYFSRHYTGLNLGANLHEWESVYTLTHTRYAPWLIGFGLGYFMHKNRQTKFKLSKTVQFLGWTLSLFTMVAIIFGPYFSLHARGKGTVFEAAMYESLKRVSWAIAHVWITFVCHYGYGGIVDSFLSHPIWQPFGRLSFAMYMMHMPIVRMNYGITRTELYFSTYYQFLYFLSACGITLFYAIYVTLAFESPVLVLEKIIFKKEKPVKKDNEVQEPPASIVVETIERDTSLPNKTN